MRLPTSTHDSRDFRIDALAPDFRLEDLWALPVEGGREDFLRLVEVMTSLDPTERPPSTRMLVWVRHRLGELFGWDEARARPIPGCTETSLVARLPEDLRGDTPGVDLSESFLSFVYRTDVEWAGEVSNGTVHAVMHLAWVEQPDGRWRGQLRVYVRPRGRTGEVYMRAIAPFRYGVVYPALMRQIARGWDRRATR